MGECKRCGRLLYSRNAACPACPEPEHFPPRAAMTEEERRERTRQRIGIGSVDKEKLRQSRNGANGTVAWMGSKAPPKP